MKKFKVGETVLGNYYKNSIITKSKYSPLKLSDEFLIVGIHKTKKYYLLKYKPQYKNYNYLGSILHSRSNNYLYLYDGKNL